MTMLLKACLDPSCPAFVNLGFSMSKHLEGQGDSK